MADPDIFVWLGREQAATDVEVHRAATIVADRLCGAVANPIIRNAQEKRQLAEIKVWLEARGYKQLPGERALNSTKCRPEHSVFA
jgi:type II restriction enzyme